MPHLLMSRIALVLMVLQGGGLVGPAIADTIPEGWESKSPRDEIRPAFSIETHGGPTKSGSLVITHDQREGLDGWYQKSFPVNGGEFYLFHAARKLSGVAVPRRSALVRVLWQNDEGKMVSADVPEQQAKELGHVPTAEPEHPVDGPADVSGWTTVSRTLRAPSRATRAVVELHLQWAPGGRVEWSEISFEKTSPPASRKVRLATIHYQPRRKSPRENCEEFASLLAEAGKLKADLVVLGETVPYVGVKKLPHEVAEGAAHDRRRPLILASPGIGRAYTLRGAECDVRRTSLSVSPRGI